MGVDTRLSDVEIQQAVESEWLKCKDAAYAAVDKIVQGKKVEIDGKEGLRSELVEVCAAQVARYEDLATEWMNFAGSLDNTVRGKTFKQNFVDGVVNAIQVRLLNRISGF